MELFDFIRDDRFRECLEEDYEELQRAIDVGCWKAAQVMAGSIVEAILVEYLESSDYRGRTGNDPLEMDLTAAIKACRHEKVLSEKTAGLAHLLREYRNLIHPGRQIRLGEKASAEEAEVVQALVGMVAHDVAVKTQDTLGYTAKQIVSKVMNDLSATHILRHLLQSSTEAECERLLTTEIPDTHSEIVNNPYAEEEDWKPVPALRSAFRIAFDFVSDDVKRRVMHRYVKLLKEGGGDLRRQYEDAFLRAPDLAYVDEEDLPIVKEHLLARLGEESSLAILTIVNGLALFTSVDETSKFAGPLLRMAVRQGVPDVALLAKTVLYDAYDVTSEEEDIWIRNVLDTWIGIYEERGLVAELETAREIKQVFSAAFRPPADE